MSTPTLSVREIQQDDIPRLIAYWQNAEDQFLINMGVDLSKMPAFEDFAVMLESQLHQTYPEKKAYTIIWLVDGEPSGHSNVNKIIYGEEASMHLHLWNGDYRHKGFGAELVKMTVPYFFKNLELKKLYSEPHALNVSPNKTLEKAGFELAKEYITTPGWINFEQPVKRWEMHAEKVAGLK